MGVSDVVLGDKAFWKSKENLKGVVTGQTALSDMGLGERDEGAKVDFAGKAYTPGAAPQMAERSVTADLRSAAQQQRTAPQRQMAELERARAARVGHMAEAKGAQLGSTTRIGTGRQVEGGTVGPVSTMQGTTIDQRQAEQARALQMEAMRQYQGMARGEGPSVAQAQLRAGQEAQQRAAMSMAAGARGNVGLARRQALQSQEAGMLQTNQQAAMLRAQEQQAALQGLSGLASQTRGQDIGVAAQQAGLQQQAGLASMAAQNQAGLAQAQLDQQRLSQQATMQQQAELANAEAKNRAVLAQAQMTQQANLFGAGQQNQATLAQAQMDQQVALANAQAGNQLLAGNQQAMLQQQALNDQMSMAYQQQGLSRAQANLQARLDMERMGAGSYDTTQGYQLQAALANQQAKEKSQAGIAGAVGSVIGGILSDKRAKTDIKPGSDEATKMLDALKASRFRYKDPNNGEGEWLGVMAQDMERSEAGREVVVDAGGGLKGLDPKKALSALLAAAATLHGRVKALEGV